LESFLKNLERDLAPWLRQELGSAGVAGLEISREDSELSVEWALSEAEFGRLLARLVPLAKIPPSSGSSPTASALPPDEVIPARPRQ
jgi:hypothetical protein